MGPKAIKGSSALCSLTSREATTWLVFYRAYYIKAKQGFSLPSLKVTGQNFPQQQLQIWVLFVLLLIQSLNLTFHASI